MLLNKLPIVRNKPIQLAIDFALKIGQALFAVEVSLAEARGLDQLAIGKYHLQSLNVLSGIAVFNRLFAGGIIGDRAANGCVIDRGRIWRQKQSVRLHHLLKRQIIHAWLPTRKE